MSAERTSMAALPSDSQAAKSTTPGRWPISILLCSLAFLAVILTTTIPLTRASERISGAGSLSQAIVALGSIVPLPTDLPFIQDSRQSLQITAFIEFLFFLLCLFAIYFLCARYIQAQKTPMSRSTRYSIFLVIGITTVVAAYIYVFTPSTLSNDIFLYADYGRILSMHSANPYFVPPASFPHDPLYASVYWKHVVAVYGPIWILVCAGLSSFTGTDAINLFLTFRIFACCIHIINMLLVAAILRAKGCSASTILMGTQLYAWNPLLLFESGMGGHNDLLMLMFLLIGILCALRVKTVNAISSIAALVAFTLAVLVKITIAPILLLYIGMLFFKTCTSHLSGKRLRAALLSVCIAIIVCLIVACLFYGPFWLGHSKKDILYIFSSQPPAIYAFTSLLSAFQSWNIVYPLPPPLAPLIILHSWNIFIYGTMLIVLLLGGVRLYWQPTLQNVLVMTLAVMAVFLLTTNWFLPWYVTWAVCLIVVCLPTEGTNRLRIERGLFFFALVFSFSAFLTYYHNFIGAYYGRTRPPHAMDLGWFLLVYFSTFALPALAFLIAFIYRPRVVE